MPNPPRPWLPNSRGELTRHVFARIEIGYFVEVTYREVPAYLAIFQCPSTGEERVYGCLDPEIGKAELEELYGRSMTSIARAATSGAWQRDHGYRRILATIPRNGRVPGHV